MEAARPNGKTPDLGEFRADLIQQIKSFHSIEGLGEALGQAQTIPPAAKPEVAPITITTSIPPAPARCSQREILTELAGMANVSIGMARKADRLARSGNANLVVAALLQLIPITTALRSAKPPKSNARIARWQYAAALAGETQ
jgi:hypothetical protein